MAGTGKLFEKGNKLSKGRPKGSISKKKIVWDKLGRVLDKEGADKFWKEMQKLKGVNYVKYYLAAQEYFKPKKKEVKKEIDSKLTLKFINEVVTHESLKAKTKTIEASIIDDAEIVKENIISIPVKKEDGI